MLTQNGGTLGQPANLGNYTDAAHYKIPQPQGAHVMYGLLTMASAPTTYVMAFTSSRRFVGRFDLRPASIQVVLDAEGLALAPGERWTLEEFSYGDGADRDALLRGVAQRLSANHSSLLAGSPPPLALARASRSLGPPAPSLLAGRGASPPTGWCSWYCFGPRVTARQVLDNLDTIAKNIPGLKYIQVDDGYQPAMGDWLDTGAAFGGNVRGVLTAIRERGFEPAIWVAPFIAEQASKLFQQHPAWFVKDDEGKPLRADRVTFGGWRRGPWYALDGTHPEAQAHLETVFGTMRREWGCTYFKLDANFWGAMHGGRFHDPRATRVEAYRRGMDAIRRGAGDAFILGCNHPIWPSLGLIHGSRSSNDIKRAWDRVATTARQNLNRNWQNGRLWWNDPDAVVLTGDLTDEEFRFHATSIYASGGMVLSGDDLTKIGPDRLKMLQALLPPSGVAAAFADDSLNVGVIDLPGRRVVSLLNWTDAPQTLSVSLRGAHHVRELWTGEDRGRHAGGALSTTVPAHGGRLLVCTPA
jgi:alpha-galactosidase